MYTISTMEGSSLFYPNLLSPDALVPRHEDGTVIPTEQFTVAPMEQRETEKVEPALPPKPAIPIFQRLRRQI